MCRTVKQLPSSCITCITAIGNLLTGLLTVCIPVIAVDLNMSQDLQLWPASAFALACGCTLLPFGAIADVLGCRRVSWCLGAIPERSRRWTSSKWNTTGSVTCYSRCFGILLSSWCCRSYFTCLSCQQQSEMAQHGLRCYGRRSSYRLWPRSRDRWCLR